MLSEDAVGQAALVRSGAVSAAELVEASIEQIERVNPEINAVIHPLFDQARAAVREDRVADGPFTGVPILLKDLGAMEEGELMTAASRLLNDIGWRAPADDVLTVRLRDAGFVFVGRTNCSELANCGTTEPVVFGPTVNPWDTRRTVGGSSGGSGAAVASGMVAAAHGNDGGGSIRLPASANGVVSVKPTRGRVSRGPNGEAPGGFAVDGMLCRTVRDAAALLDVIAGSAPGDPHPLPKPDQPFAVSAAFEPPGLRVAVVPHELGAPPTDPEVVAVVEQTARALEALGHEVTDDQPPLPPWGVLLDDFVDAWSVGTADFVAWIEQQIGRPVTEDDLEPYNFALVEHAKAMAATHYAAGASWRAGLCRTLGEWWAEGQDLLLAPIVRTPPPRLGDVLLETPTPLEGWRRHFDWLPFTSVWNLTGQPAIALPVGQSTDGLPIGVQLIGDHAREDLLLQVGAQLEQALPWRDRHPPQFPRS